MKADFSVAPRSEVAIIKSRPHRNKTEGHWEAILDEAEAMAQSGDYRVVYANKGLGREVPDVWGGRSADDAIDQVEVPSKTDVIEDLIDRMEDIRRSAY